MRVIFISDLDGTLLGQTDFRFEEIKGAIIAFLAKGISLIPASSKTQPEIEDFCRLLGVDLPFICENGAALVNSHLLHRKSGTGRNTMSSHVLGLNQSALLRVWRHSLRPNLQENCIFLDEMDAAGQEAILGLAGEQLAMAMDRSHSALFTFKGTPSEFGVLQEQAVQAGLLVQCGGRVCALSAPHDKASYHQLIRRTVVDEGATCIIVGFGDAQNDVSMLQKSDVACVIPRPGCQPLVLSNPPQMLIQASAVAPLGWLEAAKQALHIIEQKHGEQNG